MSAVFLPTNPVALDTADRYAMFEPIFEKIDLVLVEGDSLATAPKLEVWRAELGSQPLASANDSILAVITDDEIEIAAAVQSRSNIKGLADWILKDVLGTASR